MWLFLKRLWKELRWQILTAIIALIVGYLLLLFLGIKL
jgi:hypothetical protein